MYGLRRQANQPRRRPVPAGRSPPTVGPASRSCSPRLPPCRARHHVLCMARVNSDEKPPSPSSSPTAVHIAAVAQDTPSSLLSSITIFGVDCTAQLVPFQASATVRIPALESDTPTAVHALAEVHEIAVRESCKKFALELGFGVALIFHVPLLHCSASVRSAVKLEPLLVLGKDPVPAAMHTVLDEHFTPLS
jgi:hypothetical protein